MPELRSFSTHREIVECDTLRSSASFSPETAIVMFCINANNNSSSFLSMGLARRHSQMDIGGLNRMRQSANGDAIDSRFCIAANIIQRDSARGLQRNTAPA